MLDSYLMAGSGAGAAGAGAGGGERAAREGRTADSAETVSLPDKGGFYPLDLA